MRQFCNILIRWICLSIVLAGPSQAAAVLPLHGRWHRALMIAHIIVPGQLTRHVRYICTVDGGGGRPLRIVDLLQTMPSSTEPRNFRHLIAFSTRMRVMQTVDITGVEIRRCRRDSIILSDSVDAGDNGSGNKITFYFGGEGMEVTGGREER